MKKIFISLILTVCISGFGFSMIAPSARLEVINESQIKTPAVVKSVRTINNRRGNRTQLVKLDGLYNNSAKKYEAKCYNFKGVFPWDVPVVGGGVLYTPKTGQRVFVTIDRQGGEITSVVIMDKKFEDKLQKTPQKLKYNYKGAYFED
jgi:hypothetical protein